MKKNNLFVTLLFSILFLGSIFFYFVNNNKVKHTTMENNSLKTEFKSLKAENMALTEINYQLLQTNTKVSEKINKLKTTLN